MATVEDNARSETKPALAVTGAVLSGGHLGQVAKNRRGASPGVAAARATQATDALLDQQLRARPATRATPSGSP